MKKIPDINDALVSAVAKKLLELYKDNDPNFIPLLEYIIFRAFTAAANPPENLLSTIKCTYDVNNLFALAKLLKKIHTDRGLATINDKIDRIVQGILCHLFPDPQQLIANLNNLLIFHFELTLKSKDHSENIQYILEKIVRSFRSIKSYQECLKNYFKQLLVETVNSH